MICKRGPGRWAAGLGAAAALLAGDGYWQAAKEAAAAAAQKG